MQILNVNNLAINYGFNTLFDDVSFSLNEGESISIVGPNGCGKSTLLHGMSRLLKPISGEVSLNGVSVHEYKPKEMNQLLI